MNALLSGISVGSGASLLGFTSLSYVFLSYAGHGDEITRPLAKIFCAPFFLFALYLLWLGVWNAIS